MTSASAQEPGAMVRMLAFSPDGKLLAVGSGAREEAGRVTVWDIASRKPRWSRAEAKGVSAVAFAPDGKTLVISAYEPFAKFLNMATGQQLGTLGDHDKPIRTLAISSDGRTLATGSFDLTVQVWDLPAHTKRHTLKGHPDFPLWLAFSGDGTQLFAGTNQGNKLWDVAVGQEKREWKRDLSSGNCAIFSPDDHWALMGCHDGMIRIWDTATWKLRCKLGGTGGLLAMAMDPADKTLAACSHFGKSVYLWEPHLQGPTQAERIRIRALLAKLDDDSYAVREEASRDLQHLGLLAEADLQETMKTTSSVEVRIRCRRIRQEILAKPGAELLGHESNIQWVAFSPDGKLLASGDRDGEVILWDVANRKELARLTPEPRKAPSY